MRKTILLITIAVLVFFSLTVFAEEAQTYLSHENDDGIIIDTNVNEANTTLPYVHDRSGSYYADVDKAELNQQSAEVTLDAEAYIPCYLKLVLTGNLGKTSVESFGPDADAVKSEDRYYITFDNEVGGYINENWEVVGHGRNAEIAPGTGHYIRACDIFKVELYSNDNYKYEVFSAPLTTDNADVTAADKNLDIQMRSKVDDGSWSATWSFSNNNLNLIGQKHSCESMTVLHDFRVPYLKTTAHGQYGGAVTFRAYTI